MTSDHILSKAQATTNLYEPAPLHAVMRSEIDASLRFPLLLLVRCSAFWFLIGSFLSLLSVLKLVVPSFLDGMSLLTYGRLFPVAYDLLFYGWAIQIGMALIFWLLARLCGTTLRYTTILVSATLLWNLGIFLSSLAVVCGYSTSVPFLEYPAWGSFILFVAFVLMGVWALLLLSTRQPRSLYISQWYLVAALCSFPWLYATANLSLVWGHVQGSAQGPISFWYVGNIIGLWLVPLALGTAYYIIPKLTRVPIYSYYLAVIGFFAWLFFAAWSGMTLLLGGPIPAWMGSASVIATVLLLLPMTAILVNFFNMLRGKKNSQNESQEENLLFLQSPALRFTAVGIVFFVVFTLMAVINAIPSLNALLRFTDYTTGLMMSGLLGFFGMTLFGALYYMMPRLVGLEWASTKLVRWHFWMLTIGVSLMVVATTLGGMIEGVALEDPVIAFINVTSYAAPWRWLTLCAWLLILLGAISFVRLLVIMRWHLIEDPSSDCIAAATTGVQENKC